MELNRNTEVESLQVSPPDAKPVLYAVPSLVYNEDCVEGMKRFSDNHFDLAIVDPPYGIGVSKSKEIGYKGFNKFTPKDWDNETPKGIS